MLSPKHVTTDWKAPLQGAKGGKGPDLGAPMTILDREPFESREHRKPFSTARKKPARWKNLKEVRKTASRSSAVYIIYNRAGNVRCSEAAVNGSSRREKAVWYKDK